LLDFMSQHIGSYRYGVQWSAYFMCDVADLMRNEREEIIWHGKEGKRRGEIRI
jgi:hypothetical protein